MLQNGTQMRVLYYLLRINIKYKCKIFTYLKISYGTYLYVGPIHLFKHGQLGLSGGIWN